MKVFVYGTLKRGRRNHFLLHNRAVHVANGVTHNRFDMIDVGFPVLFPVEDGDQVSGEIYEVDRDTLVDLDGLESEGRMYDRRLELVHTDAGDELCMIYIGRNTYWHNTSAPQVSPTNGILTF
jgi:gamma-glutamylcyclotransferase (GGCT)/AIG2-like uncharacterized protein YtfP